MENCEEFVVCFIVFKVTLVALSYLIPKQSNEVGKEGIYPSCFFFFNIFIGG